MNIGATKGDLISSLIAKHRPSVMVELGGYVGYSAIRFGDALRRAGGKQYLSLEINSEYAAVAGKLVELAGLNNIVRIIVAPAHLSLTRLLHDNVIDHIELLFFDHFKDRYLPDLWLVERLGLLKPGVSTIVADNVGRGPTLDYVAYLQADTADKRKKIEQSGARNDLNRTELLQAVQGKSEEAAVTAIENVAGDPSLKYETEVHEFTGRHPGHKTSYGPVQGRPAFNSTPSGNLTNWENITVWKGIPSAASTAGQNRFRFPEPAESWSQTLLAKDFGAVYPSATSGNNDYTINEDCLNLKIWSVADSSDAKLPVVMWSYPAESTAADVLFDGGGMADKGIVYVNYNYRTGSFGCSGNWGMLDQFAALKWIHANIAAFGGDPDHTSITVMGESAGSAATCHIVNSPLTKGLIVGAIIESGVRDPHDPLATSLAEGY
ncbi:hypothetical protein LTS07_007356 [Exophiala sideris]|nr:hypothetical protein LTS07_007356 [Exophiala sideris]KAK5034061.1 hypothetical protein LTR13_006661 [Exophiala sideris]KAK5181003.1 hypothetical protein LTR44_006823 [Eurotiomycetes sp. CCFEE 6388]